MNCYKRRHCYHSYHSNASVTTFPPSASHAPIENGSKNVAVIGPDATPPESNAIAVNIFGTKNVNPRATAYPGSRNHKIEIPVSTRTIASPRENATPMDRLIPIAFAEMAPEVSSSTCSVNTYTAGSAFYDKVTDQHTDRHDDPWIGKLRNHLTQIITCRHKSHIYPCQEKYKTYVCINDSYNNFLPMSFL